MLIIDTRKTLSFFPVYIIYIYLFNAIVLYLLRGSDTLY